MRILGNIQLLPSCSRVPTSLTNQNAYCGCGASQCYHCGMFAMHKVPFVAAKFRLRRIKKKWKKRAKNEKLRFAKNSILFLRVHELEMVLGVNNLVFPRLYQREKKIKKICTPL